MKQELKDASGKVILTGELPIEELLDEKLAGLAAPPLTASSVTLEQVVTEQLGEAIKNLEHNAGLCQSADCAPCQGSRIVIADHARTEFADELDKAAAREGIEHMRDALVAAVQRLRDGAPVPEQEEEPTQPQGYVDLPDTSPQIAITP